MASQPTSKKRPPAGARPAGAGDPERLPSSVRALEQEIQARRARLAATVDELAARTTPQALARSGADGVTRKIRGITHTPEGDLRTERLAAVAGAVVVVIGFLSWARRRH